MLNSTAIKSLLLFSYASVVSAAVFTVGVGKDETTGHKGIGFDPSVIMPSSGDQIVFEFRSGVHSVVESTFEDPCTPKPGGFNGGVHTVADDVDVDAAGLPTVTLLVNDSQPLWQVILSSWLDSNKSHLRFFDQAGGKCYLGGVLAANPTSSQTAVGFKENASKAGSTPVNTTSASSNTPLPTQTAPGTSPNTSSNSAVGFVLDRVVVSALGLGLLGTVIGIF